MKVRITAGIRPISAWQKHKRSSLERHFAQRREQAQDGLKKQVGESSKSEAWYQGEKR